MTVLQKISCTGIIYNKLGCHIISARGNLVNILINELAAKGTTKNHSGADF